MEILLVLLALVVPPGLVAAAALHRGDEAPLHLTAALVFGLGYALVGAVAYVLVLLGSLRPVPFLVTLAAVTVGLTAVALRRQGVRRRAIAVVDQVRAEPWTIAGALAVLAAMAVVRLGYLDGVSLLRYWVDAVEIAQVGGIPEFTAMYGSTYATVTSKVFLNGFTAATSLVIGRNPLDASGALLWVGAVGTAFAVWALGRELGLRFTAVLLPLLLLSNRTVLNTELTRDLLVYKAETFGRVVGLCGVVLAIRALRERAGRRDLLVAGALLGVAAGTHLVSAAVLVALLGSYALARIAVERRLLAIARPATLVLVAAGVLGGALQLAPTGDLGLQGAQRPQEYRRLEVDFDPTLYLHTGIRRPSPPDSTWFVHPGRIVSMFVAQAAIPGYIPPLRAAGGGEVPIRPTAAAALLLGAAALAAAILLWFPPDLRPTGVVAVVFAVPLVAGALVFSYRYEVWVTATFGIRRLFDYNAFSVALLALTLVEGGLSLLGRRRVVASVLALVLVLSAAALLLPPTRARPGRLQAERKVVAFADWVRANVPCEARILANKRTTGIFKGLTGRTAILEGMGPYLRPDMLADVVRLLLSARRFFRDPAPNRAVLDRHDVDYVILLEGLPIGYPGPIGRPDVDGLAEAAFLERIEGSGPIHAYRVVRRAEPDGTSTRDPRDCPTTPVPTSWDPGWVTL